MSDKPLVSVVIPTYNRERSVTRAIESAQKQSYPNIEILVVDNASTDGTEATVRTLAEQDERIRYYRNEKNLGPVPNWKRGIELSRGEYVKILFSDDCLEPEAVKAMVQAFEEYGEKLGFVYSKAIVHHQDKVVDYGPPHECGKLIDTMAYFEAVVGRFKETIFTPCMGLFRREDLLKGFLDRIPHRNRDTEDFLHSRGIGYDVILYWKTAERYDYIYAIDQPLVHLYGYNLDDEKCITLETNVEKLMNGYWHGFLYWLATSSEITEKEKTQLYSLIMKVEYMDKARNTVKIFKMIRRYYRAGIFIEIKYWIKAWLLIYRGKID